MTASKTTKLLRQSTRISIRGTQVGGPAKLALTLGLLFPALSHAAGPAQTAPLPLTITVQTGPRQTFAGLGASVFPWTPAAVYNRQVTPAQTRYMARLLWHDARLRSVRLWIHPGEEPVSYYVDGYVGTHKLPDAIAAGATDLILAPDHMPPAMNDGHGYIRGDAIPQYAALLAGFIADFKAQTGILINHCGVLNEPNDRPVKPSNAQWPVLIKALRVALDARGLSAVGIVAPESANCGADAYAVVDSIHADPQAWRDLEGIATHSYNNAATEGMAERRHGKEYWTTESGGITDSGENAGDRLQAASVSSRFLNDVNHGVTHWQFFIGTEYADPAGNTDRLLKYDPKTAGHPLHLTVLQKYYSLRQLSGAFDTGAVFRHCLSSLGGEMTYTYGKKPHVNAAAAENPDGSWAVGLSNFTAPGFQDADDPANFPLHNSGYHAQVYAVTVRVPELATLPALRFAVRRSGGTPPEIAVMHRGVLTVPGVGPLDLVTLRSLPPGRVK